MAGKSATFRVEVVGLRETLRAYGRYGKQANGELRDAAQDHARQLVPVLEAAAAAAGKQAKMTAVLRTPRDRVPVIVAGGSVKLAPATARRRRPAAGDVFFGAEFGGGARDRTRQFPAAAPDGRWFFPTLRANVGRLFAAYSRTLEQLAARWAAGG